jgi:hypothetical protein
MKNNSIIGSQSSIKKLGLNENLTTLTHDGNFEEGAECEICFLLKEDNRILTPCGHSFCFTDIQKLPQPICPKCRKSFNVPQDGVSYMKDYYKNSHVERLLKSNTPIEISTNPEENSTKKCEECMKPAAVFCENCELYLCSSHEAIAHRLNSMKKHKRIQPSQRVDPIICDQHKKEIDIYCKQCDQLICSSNSFFHLLILLIEY